MSACPCNDDCNYHIQTREKTQDASNSVTVSIPCNHKLLITVKNNKDIFFKKHFIPHELNVPQE